MRSDDRLTVADIEQWVANDEGLYNWHRREGGRVRDFIRRNREELERVIRAVLDGRKPAHYLAYGG